jgi:hypothetical protein
MSVGPTEVTFDSEHQRTPLPVISCQYTAHDTIGWRAGLGEYAVINHSGLSPEIANVTANIESRPIVGGIDCHHWRFRIRPRWQIRGERGVDANNRNDCGNNEF